jgi:hypothetical protein
LVPFCNRSYHLIEARQSTSLDETQVIHYALKRLATEVLPAYAADEGPLSATERRTIQRVAGGRRGKHVRSSLVESR